MADRRSSLATKDDLHLLETKMATKEDLELLRIATKEDLVSFEKQVVGDIMRHFDVTVETIRHDLTGANDDEVASLKNRVTRIESHFGLR